MEPTAPVSTEETKTKQKTKKRNKKKKNKEVKETNISDNKGEALDLQTIKNVLSTLDQDTSASSKKWKFWDTQPVTKFNEVVNEVGVIEADKEQIRDQPYSLPAEFEWDTIELDNPSQLQEVYELLNENYVEDEDNMFRFDYSAQFLQWVLRPPGWISFWHCGVRVKKSRKLVGFISAIPATIRVYDVEQKMVEINFLCVHKKLRHKRVAPVLIKEVTRRVNMKGIFQAVYTAGVVLPKPVAKCKYYHRSLNPRKLVNVKFSHLSRNQTMQRLVKLMRLPEEPLIKGIRELKQEDIPQCHKLLGNHLKKFHLSPVFTEEEFAHFFKPRKGIIYTYVVADENGIITDMSSFFSLPSSIMLNPDYNMLHAAYSYYTVATQHSLTELMKDMLILAKKNDFDVFNALDLMDNHQFLKELKFGMGDGSLNYYLYNFKCPDIKEHQVALVLQ